MADWGLSWPHHPPRDGFAEYQWCWWRFFVGGGSVFQAAQNSFWMSSAAVPNYVGGTFLILLGMYFRLLHAAVRNILWDPSANLVWKSLSMQAPLRAQPGVDFHQLK